MASTKMGSHPNHLIYSIFLTSFALLYLCLDVLVQAQDIVEFPAGTPVSISTPQVINDEFQYDLLMSGATTTKDNQTICTGFKLPASPSEFWIIQFEGKASVDVVHHMTLYGCDVPQLTKPCGCAMPGRSPLHSWVRNTPKVRFTGSGTTSAGGFRIGGSSDKQFLFLEIHYCHAGTTNDRSGITIHTTTDTSSFFDLAIFPIMGLGTIPTGQEAFRMDTCATPLPSSFAGSVMAFGFQVHSHNLGRLITAYYVAGETSYILGQGNPLWPEAYIPIPEADQQFISSGNLIMTRCIFDSRGASGDTNTNGRPKTTWNEMCIFNLLVMQKPPHTPLASTKNAFLKGICSSSSITELDNQADSFTLLGAVGDIDTDAASTSGITTTTYSYSLSASGTSFYDINMGGETFNDGFQ